MLRERVARRDTRSNRAVVNGWANYARLPTTARIRPAQKQALTEELEAESRRTEALIGELLGPAEIGANQHAGAPTTCRGSNGSSRPRDPLTANTKPHVQASRLPHAPHEPTRLGRRNRLPHRSHSSPTTHLTSMLPAATGTGFGYERQPQLEHSTDGFGATG
jgi:hypothetical protein